MNKKTIKWKKLSKKDFKERIKGLQKKATINKTVHKTMFDDVKDTPAFKRGYKKSTREKRGKL